MPTVPRSYHAEVLQTIKDAARYNKWFSAPLSLGGIAGEAGGSGVPVGGIYGQLIQTKVAYDTTELATPFTYSGGLESLVDNLNHIRWRLFSLEDVLPQSRYTITFEDVTDQVPGDTFTVANTPISGSVMVHIDGVMQRPTYYVVDYDAKTITTDYTTVSGDEVLIEYLVDTGEPWAGLTIAEETTIKGSGVTALDFHGAFITVSGNAATIVITGSGLAAALDDLQDVVISSPGDNDLLAYDTGSSKWIDQTAAEAGLSTVGHTHTESNITDLDHDAVAIRGIDVVTWAPTTSGQVLTYDGTVWGPETVSGVGGSHDPVTVQDTASIDLELTGQALSGYVIPGGVDHDQLLNFAANEHFTEGSIDHANIQSIGTTSHADIDAHIASGYIHTPSGHIHDDRYYTETEVDGLLHDSVTVVDTASLNLELTGQALSGYVIAGGINLGELGDVSVAGVSQGEVLTYDGGDWIPSGISAGTLDHGTLTGLGDDDHTQYLTSGRADDWFFNQSHTNLLDIGTTTHVDIDAHIASGYIHTPSGHIHDDRYYTETEVDGLLHSAVTVVDTASLNLELTGQALSGYVLDNSHSHTEANISNLVHDAIKLQGRNISSAAPADNYVLTWDAGNSWWEPAPPSGAASAGDSWITEDVTSQVPDAGDDFWLSNSIASGTLAVYYNGLLQQPTNYIETSASGFHTYFSPVTNDELVAQYLVADVSGGAVVGSVQVEKDDVVVEQRAHILNFEGSGLQNVVNDGSNKVTITISGGGVADHGLLAGLGDDDHTQYFLLAGETTDAKLYSGADLIVYSDAGSTEKLRLDGATGNIEHQGNMTLDVKLAGSDSTLTITNTGAVGAVNVDVSGTITTEAIITDIGGSILVGQTNFHNGGDAVWYSDAGITEKARVDGATGNITTAGTVDGKDVAGHVDDTTIHFTEGSIDHGSIAGLTDDDHTQYVLRQPTANTIINESGGDFDLRIESDNVENMLFMDAGSDQIAIGTATADQHESLTISNVGQKAGGGTYDTSWVNEYTGMVLGPTGSDAGSLYLLALRGNTTDIYNNIGTNIYWNPESGDISWHKRDASKHALTYEQKVTPAGAWHEFWYIPSGTTTLNSLAYFGDSIAVFNDANRDVDFRIAGDTVTNVFVVDGGLDAVQFGNFTEYKEVSEPGTPTSTWGRVYAKSDGYLYYKNDGGTEYNLVASGGAALGDSWITEDVTSQVPDAGDDFWLSNAIASGTLAVYYNGLLQQPTNYAETSASGFHTYFSPVANDELVAQYLVENVTGGVVVGTIQVEKDDAVIHSNAAILNFEGVQNITDEGSGKVTITISGGATGDHGALTGLADDDHTQYGHLSQDEAILGQWNFHSDLEQRAYYGDTVYTRTTISGGLYHVTDSSTGFDSTVVLRGNIVNIQGNGGQELVELDPTEATFNDPGNDVDFRIKTNNNNAMLFVDGGADDIIIGDDVHPTGGVISTDENKWISTEGGYNYLAFSSIDSTLPLNTVTYYAARGTVASPSATQLNDYFMIMGARGYDDAGWDSTTASIIMQAAENWDATGHGTKMIFEVTPSGATSREDVLRLGDDTGNLSYMVSLPAVTSTETLTQDIAGLAWGDVLGSDHHSTLQHLHYGTNGYHGAFSIWGVNQYWNEEADAWAQKDSTKYGNVLQLWNRENAAHTGFSFLYTVSGYPQNFAYWITGQSDDGQGTENAWVRINETNYDMDFIVEGENESALLYTDASTDRVGIRTSSPTAFLDIYNDKDMTSGDPFTRHYQHDNAALLVDHYHYTLTGADPNIQYRFYNAEGDSIVPSGLTNNAALGTFAFYGYHTDSASFQNGINIHFRTDEDWTAGGATEATYIDFHATKDGSTSPTSFLRLSGATKATVVNWYGNQSIDFQVKGDVADNLLYVDTSADKVGIGTNLPDELLTVGSGSGPVNLKLDSGASSRVTQLIFDRGSSTWFGPTAANEFHLWSQENIDLVFASNNAEAFRISDTEVVVNDNAQDVNFRVESDWSTVVTPFFVDGALSYTIFGDDNVTRDQDKIYIAPASSQMVFYSDTEASIVLWAINTSPTSPGMIRFQKSDGSYGAESAPDSGDEIGLITFEGHDGTSSANEVAQIRVVANENYGLSNLGTRIEFRATPNASTTMATYMTLQTGLQMGSPTGGDKGSGTINVATDMYKNNSAYNNPDFVLEHWATGAIEKFKDSPGASEYEPYTIQEVMEYAKEHYRLPSMSDEPMGIFDRGDKVLEWLERLMIYVGEIEERIRELEG